MQQSESDSNTEASAMLRWQQHTYIRDCMLTEGHNRITALEKNIDIWGVHFHQWLDKLMVRPTQNENVISFNDYYIPINFYTLANTTSPKDTHNSNNEDVGFWKLTDPSSKTEPIRVQVSKHFPVNPCEEKNTAVWLEVSDKHNLFILLVVDKNDIFNVCIMCNDCFDVVVMMLLMMMMIMMMIVMTGHELLLLLYFALPEATWDWQHYTDIIRLQRPDVDRKTQQNNSEIKIDMWDAYFH